ncbi:MAG: hypothetical protein IT165_19575 [Bryobacterales bacterium]|nr:hypothetical protein [Bryobacterales bacterium]
MTNAQGRIVALDFTKGVLVLLMVVYHWLNYFVSTTGSFYKYLRFLTPSFIFITGFIISHVYLQKYASRNLVLSRRLLIRGLKLLFLFLIANIAIRSVIPTGRAHSSIEAVVSMYLTGQAIVSFSILVPIGELLILSAVLAILSPYCQHIFHLAALCGILFIAALHACGTSNTYAELVTLGVLGITVGYVPHSSLRYLNTHSTVLLVLYGCYLAAITVWAEIYPLQVMGVCVNLALIYLIGTLPVYTEHPLRTTIILLGQYSLFAYILQILILHALHFSLRNTGHIQRLLLSFLGGLAITILGVLWVRHARRSWKTADRLYSVVFA